MNSSPSSTTPASETTRAGLPNLSPTTKKGFIVVVALICVGLVTAIGALGQSAATVTFRACFGALLAILGCAQLHVSVALFKNRQNSLLQLSQPVGLSIFALSGAIATFGSFALALPEHDAACAIRQPIILTCISLMGSITVARAWRIGCLLSPILSFASSEKIHEDRVHSVRAKVMRILSKLSGWALVVGSCGRFRTPSERDATKRIRKQITLAESVRLVAVLVLPQVMLQVVNLSVSSVRMQSVELYEDIYACQSDTGPLFLILGTILATVPFFVALLLNVKSEGMHDVCREFDQLITCGKACVGVLIITLPTIGMVADIIPNARTYLLAASLMSFILPLHYQISWSRLHIIKRSKGMRNRLVMKKANSSSAAVENGDDHETIQMAEEASASSKMFETLGNLKKAIEVNNDILTMFKSEGDYAYNVGFTNAEINSFGPKSLKLVVGTLISNSQRWIRQSGSRNWAPEEHQEMLKKGCRSNHEALEIFERAPAKASIEDRSFILPGYSSISQGVNGGIMMNGNKSPIDLENENASNFVKESQFQLYHYCRASAMKIVPLVKMQKFDEAFFVLDKMKTLCDPALHTAAIARKYGTDWCATMIATSALWHNHLNQTEQALNVCGDVIQHILPEVGKTNVDNSNQLGVNYLLYPIIRVLIAQGQDGVNRAYDVYNSHVLQPFNSGVKRSSPGTRFICPLKALLMSYTVGVDQYNIPIKYDGIEEDIKWMLNDETKIADEFDTFITNVFSLSFYSLLAEICLQLAKRVEIDSGGKQRDLVGKGLQYSSLANPKMNDIDGNVTNHIAFEFHSRVHLDLSIKSQMFRRSSTAMGLAGSAILAGSMHRLESMGSVPGSITNENAEGRQQYEIANIPV